MSYKPRTLSKLLEEKNRELFLPHIQRPFVWEWAQIERFLDSLLKNYPIQTLLFWRTKSEIRSRKFMDNYIEDSDLSTLYDRNISADGIIKTLVLDGQQRLQSLFLIYNGMYENKDVYINLQTGNDEIHDGIDYELKLSSEGLALPYYKIKKLCHDKRNINDIIDDINDKIASSGKETIEEKKIRERLVRRTLSQLYSILYEEKHFWIEELDGVANSDFDYKAVLNIFIRVNSGGTKLESSDLMFAIMKEAWIDVEENIEAIVNNLNSSGKIKFDKDFVLKCLMLIIDKGPELNTELFTAKKGEDVFLKLENVWDEAEKAFLQLKDFIYNDLGIYSEKVIRSYNAIIPIFEYLFYHRSPKPENRELMKSYYYCSQFFNWYSARTDQILAACHRIIKNAASDAFPLREMKLFFRSNHNKQTELSDELIDMRLRYIVLNMIYIETNGTSPFNVAFSGNEPQIDHIYPKSKLKEQVTSEINHIGNYRFIGASDNNKKRAESADSYFSRLKESGVNIKRHLLVEAYSSDPKQLVIENYIDFRDKRYKIIHEYCKNIINRDA
jgi:uncharacterized protein with ParB-like and HNH nuclease domain